jgi:hypothetical protein
MNAYKSIAWTGTVALLATGFLAVPGTAKADGANSMQVITLLANAKTTAVQAKEDAARLADFGRLDIKWEAHAGAVAQMREHVMALNEEIAGLKAAEGAVEPWQKEVIARITPYMAELASDNEAILDQFEAHPSLFGTPASSGYLAANVASATYLSALIVNFVENGTLRQVIENESSSSGLIGVAQRTYGLES